MRRRFSSVVSVLNDVFILSLGFFSYFSPLIILVHTFMYFPPVADTSHHKILVTLLSANQFFKLRKRSRIGYRIGFDFVELYDLHRVGSRFKIYRQRER